MTDKINYCIRFLICGEKKIDINTEQQLNMTYLVNFILLMSLKLL